LHISFIRIGAGLLVDSGWVCSSACSWSGLLCGFGGFAAGWSRVSAARSGGCSEGLGGACWGDIGGGGGVGERSRMLKGGYAIFIELLNGYFSICKIFTLKRINIAR
jgi:hypothetical protein